MEMRIETGSIRERRKSEPNKATAIAIEISCKHLKLPSPATIDFLAYFLAYLE